MSSVSWYTLHVLCSFFHSASNMHREFFFLFDSENIIRWDFRMVVRVKSRNSDCKLVFFAADERL